jgi:hypothetical protein
MQSGQPDDKQSRRKPGELATEILGILGKSATALNPGEVLDRLPAERKLSSRTGGLSGTPRSVMCRRWWTGA